MLAIVGAGDRLFANADSVRAWVAPLPDCTVRVAGVQSGLSFDPGHMPLATDRRCRPMWEGIVGWLA